MIDYYSSNYRRRGTRTRRGKWLSKNALIGAGAGAVLLSIVSLAVLIPIFADPEPEPVDVLWIAEKTTRSSGAIPDDIRDRARELARGDRASLKVVAVGQHADEVGSVPLWVEEDGGRVTEPRRVNRALSERLDQLAGGIAAADVGDTGFSLYEALRVAADETARSGMQTEVWLSTTVFTGSVDPLHVRALAENDPSQVVDTLVDGALGELDLGLVDLNLVLLTPVGEDQQELGPTSDSWRETFMTTLTDRLGASVTEPLLRDPERAEPWADASSSPAIQPLAEPAPPPPPPPPPRPGESQKIVIDNAAFHSDKADLVDEAGTRALVADLAARVEAANGAYRVEIVGHCAKFGRPEGARALSQKRAGAIKDMFVAAGISSDAISATGVGYDIRADETQDPASAAQRVVVITLVPIR